MTDNEVTAALLRASRDQNEPGHVHAKRMSERLHFKRLYERNPADQGVNRNSVELVYTALTNQFDVDGFRRDKYLPRLALLDFPVLQSNGRIESSLNLSTILQQIPTAAFDLILCDRAVLDTASEFLTKNREAILAQQGE
jgi:hypothetical protein